MRVLNVHRYKNVIIQPAKKYTKNFSQKTKDLEKKAGFMSKPIKYYLIGLAFPVPFASTVGFLYGLGAATYNKFFKFHKNEKSS